MIAINMDKPKSCIDCPCFDFENEVCQVRYIFEGGLNINQSANNVLDTLILN